VKIYIRNIGNVQLRSISIYINNEPTESDVDIIEKNEIESVKLKYELVNGDKIKITDPVVIYLTDHVGASIGDTVSHLRSQKKSRMRIFLGDSSSITHVPSLIEARVNFHFATCLAP
jgi:uncharacterized membrane protein